MQQYPRACDEIMMLLNTHVGMAFAKAVFAIADRKPAETTAVATAATATANDTPMAAASAPTTADQSAAGSASVRADAVEWSTPRLVRVTASDSLNVRDASSTSGHVLGGLSSNEEVEAIGQEGEWFKIHHKGRVAFINAGFAVIVPHEAHAAVETKEESATVAPTPPTAPAPAPHAAAAAGPGASSGAQTAPAHAPAAPEPHAEIAAAVAHAAPTTSYLSGFTSLGGTNIADLKTTKAEADTLNELRKSDKRFDPLWLAAAQKNGLGVVATGAFNTETLRALRKHHPKLDAAGILSDQGGAISSLAPGTPFITTDSGLGNADKKSMVGATKADRAAHALGYSDYETYHQNLLPASLLGVALNKGQGSGLAHPHLLNRLAVAESFLRSRHPGMADHDIVKAIGWNGSGNAAYADDKKLNKSHFHTMGLAIDIDVAHNPYVFTGRQDIKKTDADDVKKSKTDNNWWMDMFEKHMAYAAKIYGGEKVSASILNQWAGKMSTDELYAHVAEISSSFKSYMGLAGKNDTEILRAFTAAGIPSQEAQSVLAEVKKVPHFFHDFYGRNDAASLTNHSQELLVALRDVAGFSWGGAEMSGNENGDFMHFDCRQDGFGVLLQQFNFP
ncbi:MAG: SH3 domain-containing protein [Deltaproteobacteria bacterium]